MMTDPAVAEALKEERIEIAETGLTAADRRDHWNALIDVLEDVDAEDRANYFTEDDLADYGAPRKRGTASLLRGYANDGYIETVKHKLPDGKLGTVTIPSRYNNAHPQTVWRFCYSTGDEWALVENA